MPFEVKSIKEGFGAFVTGVDLQSATDEQLGEIRRALSEYSLLVFTDGRLPIKNLIPSVRRCGEIVQLPDRLLGDRAHHAEHPGIFTIKTSYNRSETNEIEPHTDMALEHAPPTAVCLQPVSLPAEAGGDTCFIDAFAMFEDLDTELKNLLRGKEICLQNATYPNGKPYPRETIARTPPDTGSVSHIRRPIVQPGANGRPYIYLGIKHPDNWIDGLTGQKSKEVLAKLWRMSEEAKYRVRIVWRDNFCALWLNYPVLHSRSAFEGDREMVRVTLNLY